MAGEDSAEVKNADAQELKKAGNDAFARGNWKMAVEHFSSAIKLDPTDQVFYSNRSGAYANLARYEEALRDALKCVELKPDWWKGWSRKGYAEYHLNEFGASEQSYERGMKLSPHEKSLVEGRDKARAAQQGTPMGDMQKLSTAEIQERLRSGLQRLSPEELQAELAKAGIDSNGKTREEMTELLVKAPQAAAAPKKQKKPCLSKCTERCLPEKKYLTPGEAYLERRRKLLAKWKDWDEARLKKRLQKLGEEPPKTDNRDELVDLLLQAEMKLLQEKADPQRLHKCGVICAVAVMILTFGAIVLFFVFGSESGDKEGLGSARRLHRISDLARPVAAELGVIRPGRGWDVRPSMRR